MEENVVTNVVENPVVTPEVVETVAAPVQAAIEPIQVPQITVPMPESKQILGMDAQTLTDVVTAGALVGAGAGAAYAIPWLVRKIKSGIQTLTAAAKMVKNGGVELNQNQNPPAQNANTTPNQEPQNNATPVTPQENK